MLPAGFEPAVPVNERKQTDAFLVATGIYGWDAISYFTIFVFLLNQYIIFALG